jgi:hypothetical protein
MKQVLVENGKSSELIVLSEGEDFKYPDNTLWVVPITAYVQWGEPGGSSGSSSSPPTLIRTVMSDRCATLTLKPPTPTSVLRWIKFNAEAAGFYRVHYINDIFLKNLCSALDTHQFSTLDRMGIEGDLFALASIPPPPPSRACRPLCFFHVYFSFLMKHYRDENSNYVWSDMTRNIGKIMGLFFEGFNAEKKENIKPLQQNYRAWIQKLVLPKVSEFGLPKDPLTTSGVPEPLKIPSDKLQQTLWSLLLSSLSSSGHIPTVRYFLFLFDQHVLASLSPVLIKIYAKALDYPITPDVESASLEPSAICTAEDALATGVNALPPGLHSRCYHAAVSARTLFASDPQVQALGLKRRLALLAIYHCSSSLLLPV